MTLSVSRLRGCCRMLADAAHTSPVRGKAGTGVTTETQATALTNEHEAVLSCMTKLMDPPPDGEGRRFCRCHCIGRRARSPGPCSALPGPAAAGRDLSRPPGPQGSPREERAPASWVLPERLSLQRFSRCHGNRQLKGVRAHGEASPH